MNRLFPVFTLIFAFFISCAAQETTIDTQTETTEKDLTELERPIPYVPEIPDAFQSAIDNETRSPTGEPGPNYWQNESRYILDAELLPEEHKVNGTAAITYFNNSPDDLETVVIELAQNLHKGSTPKKESTEITGGITLHSIEVNGRELEEINLFQRFAQNRPGYIVNGTQLYLYPDLPLIPNRRLI